MTTLTADYLRMLIGGVGYETFYQESGGVFGSGVAMCTPGFKHKHGAPYIDWNPHALHCFQELPNILATAIEALEQNEPLRAALFSISTTPEYELNPLRYSYEQVCQIGEWCNQMAFEASKALGELEMALEHKKCDAL